MKTAPPDPAGRRVRPIGTTEGVRSATWDRLSGSYDRQLWLERAAVRAALDLACAGPDDRLLDLGTGTGEVLRELAGRPVQPRRAFGVDASDAMLARVPTLPRGWTSVPR